MERPQESDYLYQARVLAVIDGDTLDVEIDLGFRIKREQRLRLAGLNASAYHTQKGRDAKRFLSEQLLQAGTLAIKTHRVDSHGRYVAHLFLAPHKTSTHLCFTNGSYLNALLVESGFARRSK